MDITIFPYLNNISLNLDNRNTRAVKCSCYPVIIKMLLFLHFFHRLVTTCFLFLGCLSTLFTFVHCRFLFFRSASTAFTHFSSPPSCNFLRIIIFAQVLHQGITTLDTYLLSLSIFRVFFPETLPLLFVL